MVTRWMTLNKPPALASPRFSLLCSELNSLHPFCPSGLLYDFHELTELEMNCKPCLTKVKNS